MTSEGLCDITERVGDITGGCVTTQELCDIIRCVCDITGAV